MKLNDYELIYLYNEGNENILDIILNKYKPLVYLLIKKMNIPYVDKEDFLQEGLMILYKCINSYSEDKGLFFNYCNVAIKRRFFTLINKKRQEIDYLLTPMDNTPMLKEKTINYEISHSREFETLLEIKQTSIKEYAKTHNMNVKKVYNYITKLKNTIKNSNK